VATIAVGIDFLVIIAIVSTIITVAIATKFDFEATTTVKGSSVAASETPRTTLLHCQLSS
jgi:hypothetical protein